METASPTSEETLISLDCMHESKQAVYCGQKCIGNYSGVIQLSGGMLTHRYNNQKWDWKRISGSILRFVCIVCVPLSPTKYKLCTSLTVQAPLTESGHCIVGVLNLNSIVKWARNGVLRVEVRKLQCSLWHSLCTFSTTCGSFYDFLRSSK